MSASFPLSSTVGDFDKGASYGCLRCGEYIQGPEEQDSHNASKHSQPQGGGTAYRAIDKTKV